MLLLALSAVGAVVLQRYLNPPLPEGFASGNGRLEATQVDVATRYGGRVAEVLVEEGDWVRAGQLLARMDTATLDAQIKQAEASLQQARDARLSAQAQVAQRASELEYARRELSRAQELLLKGFVTRSKVDGDQTRVQVAEATLAAARAQAVAADSSIAVAEARLEQYRAERDDALLRAPRDGRVQYRLAQPGEVLEAGGRVLTLLDLGDVTMSVFLPETVVGRVALGAEGRIVLDVLPERPIPARVSFVAGEAQFTPKQVETRSEREKLMFRVRLRIPRELLEAHKEQVKTGLPGVGWIRLDPDKPWPRELQTDLAP
ncbi:MAG TPA: HlyD family efflux transporter periplasmic adaptor subunit [Candidatus Competibacteraceae bacterium]|nr:HlyD family efflux transporter periplasmic adaptor subunit [Candidatus Competibacteraceae bacterium]